MRYDSEGRRNARDSRANSTHALTSRIDAEVVEYDLARVEIKAAQSSDGNLPL